MLPAEDFSKGFQFPFLSRLDLCFVTLGDPLVISVSPVVQSIVFFFSLILFFCIPARIPYRDKVLLCGHLKLLHYSEVANLSFIINSTPYLFRHPFCSALRVVGTIPSLLCLPARRSTFPFQEGKTTTSIYYYPWQPFATNPQTCKLL